MPLIDSLPIKPFALIALLVNVILMGCAKKTEVAEDIRPVRVMHVIANEQQVMAEYAGNIQPRIQAQIGFRVAGKISARKVDVGSVVKAGQILMQLDPEDLHLAKMQAEGGFKAAEANLTLANNELARYQTLRQTNAVSVAMLDAKVTAAAAAAGSFEQAKAQLKSQSNQAKYANLVANSDGVVTAINAEVGQVVSAGTPVIHVAQLSELEVVVAIPENNLDAISHASDVSIRLWAASKDAIPGKLREISPIADPATRTFSAKVSILSTSAKVVSSIKMGMTANVQFSVNTPTPFIKVPLSALLQEKGATHVWLVENGMVKLAAVQIGGVSGNDLLLTSGVSAGQTLVTAGVHLLKNGQHVSILEAELNSPVNSEPYLSQQTLLKSAGAAVAIPVTKAGAAK